MKSVKILKPYLIKSDEYFIIITLAYRYFSLLIDQKTYQFIPIESKEIVVDRKTKRILNMDAVFAFQKDEKIIYFQMTELITFPDFLMQLSLIVDTYEEKKQRYVKAKENVELERLFQQLEHENLKRLIDQALDKRDKKQFQSLVKQLKSLSVD